MRLELEVELRDTPGQLMSVLETLGRYGANIVTIVHDRSRLRNGRLPVLLAFDAPPEGTNHLLEAIRAHFRVLRLSGATDTHLAAFLLIGHVIQDDLSHVTEAVFKGGAEVRRVRAEVAAREEPSAVLVDVAAATEAKLADALRRVRALSEERGYVLLEALGVDA